jgi:hypothetical protein
MQGISASSQKVVDIISVIEGIAFQTNIPAPSGEKRFPSRARHQTRQPRSFQVDNGTRYVR